MCIVLKHPPYLFAINSSFNFITFFLLFGYKMQSNVDFQARKSFFFDKNCVSTAKTLTLFLRSQLMRFAKNRVKLLGVNFLQLVQGLRNHSNKSLCESKLIFAIHLNSIEVIAAWSSAIFNTFLALRLYFIESDSEKIVTRNKQKKLNHVWH